MEGFTEKDILEFGRLIGEMAGSLKNIEKKMDDFISSADKRHDELEDRVNTLESERDEVKGAAKATKGISLFLGAAAGGMIQIVTLAVQWFFTRNG